MWYTTNTENAQINYGEVYVRKVIQGFKKDKPRYTEVEPEAVLADSGQYRSNE